MKRRIFHVSLLFFALLFSLAGCEKIECGQYERFFSDDASREALQNWADSQIFVRSFQQSELTSFGLVGPGKKRILTEIRSFERPGSLESKEIRLLGDNAADPAGVFVGSASYKGLLISRCEMEDLLKSEGILADEVLDRRDRVARICRPWR